MEQPAPPDLTPTPALTSAGSLHSASGAVEADPPRGTGVPGPASATRGRDAPDSPHLKSVQLTPLRESPSPQDAAEPAEQQPARTPEPAPSPVLRALHRLRRRLGQLARGAARMLAAAGRLRAAPARRVPRAPADGVRAASSSGKLMLFLVMLNDVLLAATLAMLLLKQRMGR